MKNWLVGLLCAGLIIGSAVMYFTKNNKKIKYESDILVVYKYGGGMGTYLDTHDTYITIYSNGTYEIEIPKENKQGSYKFQDTIDSKKFDELQDVLQKNNFKDIKKADLTKECLDCGSETLAVYFSDDDIYAVKANIFDDEKLSSEEKIYINIKKSVVDCIPESKLAILEKALGDNY